MKRFPVGATLDQFMVPLVFDKKPSQAMIEEQFEPGGAVHWNLRMYGFLDGNERLRVILYVNGEDRYTGPTQSGHYIVLVKCATTMYTLH